MTASAVVAGPVCVRGRFHRSVQLEQDWRGEGAADYVVTPTVQALTGRIIGELGRPAGVRAWSITGPYGTGKSSFALFLAKLLAGQLHNPVPASPDRPLLPVLLVGQRSSLKSALLSTLASSLRPIAPGLAASWRKAALASPEDAVVVGAFERAAQAVQGAGYGGIFVVVDEFGKFLEHTAHNLSSEDLLVMQSLAETAARSPTPFVLMTILHTAFDRYLGKASEVQQAEWQKVQGRFTDVAFQEPPEQLLRLVGRALISDFNKETASAYQTAIHDMVNADALAESRQRFSLAELLPACAPLHPVTALLLWPLFRSKLAQNERSLFSFLSSREPFGFQDFLGVASWQEAPFYRPAQLYDYVLTSLGTGAYRGEAGRRWVEIDEALHRLGADAPALAPAVLKTLGLLWLYGAPVGLRASEGVIALAVGDAAGAREALAYLEHRSIVVYRRFEGAYALWEGSDINLDAAFAAARQKLGSGDLARRLTRALELRAQVARAHYIQTGTLRYFGVAILEGSAAALREHLRQAPSAGHGSLSYVLCDPALSDPAQGRAALVGLAQDLTADAAAQLRIFCFPKAMVGLEDALAEVETWRSLRDTLPGLAGDRAAKRELAARLEHAQTRLEAITGRVFGLRGHRFDPGASDIVQGGVTEPLTDARAFTAWLSGLCDRAFPAAPPLKNELLNRDVLSSAAKAALNRLVKAMVKGEAAPRFGIPGTPAEVSMYEAMLKEGGFHRERGGRFCLGEPDGAWQPVWHTVHDFLATTHPGRRPLTDLYDRLKAPPYGLREGPLPLLLCAVLLAHKDDVVLYYNGLFQAELHDELLELLVRVPESFEIQQIALSEEGRATLDAIGGVLRDLEIAGEKEDTSPLLSVVRPLVIAVAKLPPYSKNTRRLEPPEAADLRDAAIRATDPHDLLFKTLPTLFDASPETSEGRKTLAENLHASLYALQHAYPHLLDEIEAQLRHALDLQSTASHDLKTELTARARPLKGYAADPALSLFIAEAARQDASDWRAGVARAVLKGKPATTWNDNDAVEFQLRLRQLASDFVRLEELVAEKQATGAEQIIRVGILGSGVTEARQTVALHTERIPAVTDMADKLVRYLEELGDTQPDADRIKVAALAQAVMHYLGGGDGAADDT